MFTQIPTDPLIYLVSWFGFDIRNFAQTCQRHAHVCRRASMSLSKHLYSDIVMRCCRNATIRPMEYIPQDWLVRNLESRHIMRIPHCPMREHVIMWILRMIPHPIGISDYSLTLLFEELLVSNINVPEDIVALYVDRHCIMIHSARIYTCITGGMDDTLQYLLEQTAYPGGWAYHKSVAFAIVYRRKQALKTLLRQPFVVTSLPKYLPDWLPKNTPMRYRKMIIRAIESL